MSFLRCALALAVLVGATPALAHGGDGAGFRLLDAELTLGPRPGHAPVDLQPRLGILVAAAEPAAATPAAGGLDFDLLGSTPAPAVDPAALAAAQTAKQRRKMLNWHQGVGLALIAAELGTTVVGQLNYNDKFGGTAPANTNKYRVPHAALAISTLGLFATNGVIALLTPSADRTYKMDRVMVHRISMALATVGMLAQGYYGFRTSGREGYQDQASIGKTHLVLGYATLAAFTAGVGAITF